MTTKWADTSMRHAATWTVASAFREQVSIRATAPALQHGERIWTYAELNQRVNRLADVLLQQGVERGDRIAVLSENRPEFVELDLAAAKIGVIVACQNWRQADPELAYCIRLVAPKMVFVSERHAHVLSRIDHEGPVVCTFGAEFEHALRKARDAEPPDTAEPEDGFIILYTSGTTGLPKAALISHRAMVARGIISSLDRPADFSDAFVAWSPMFHMGATDNMFATFMRGGKVIVRDGFNAEALAEIIAREQLGHLALVPGVIEQMISELRRSGAKPKGIRSAGVMADLVPRHQLAELTTLLNAPYSNSFGSTETGSPPASRGLVPVGVVPASLSKVQSSLCSVRLVDSDGRDVPDGKPGELAMRGPSLFSGYWQAPEANAEDFRGGWFHMGDMFVRNPDRTLDFVDRRKYLIKSGGENIYPAEIERVLLASPRIAEAVVVRRQDTRWGEVPIAFVVPDDPTLSADDVKALCRGSIAGYKVPKEIRFVGREELPRNSSGKIMRADVEALLDKPQAR